MLRVEGLQVWFAGSNHRFGRRAAPVKAVDDVSFELRQGEVLGVVGQSGSGKSTLVRAVLQLIRPYAGRVYYGDADLTAASVKQVRQIRRELQLVFQDPIGSLNSRMTAGNLVAEPLRNYGVCDARQRRARVAELMAQVQLDPAWVDRYPHEFSGGQRQRLNIARALALKPRILFCDEPVSSLDVSVQAEVLNLLKDLQAQFNLTMLFISHDLAVVRHIADRVAVMYEGRIVETLEADAILSATHPYTRRLLAAVPGYSLVSV